MAEVVRAGQVAVIGWGSLLTDKGDMEIGEWEHAGPVMPIEFSRLSNKGNLTLVVDPAASPVLTWTAPLKGSLEEAHEALRVRENRPNGTRHEWIGGLSRTGTWIGGDEAGVRPIVEDWLARSDYTGAVWTSLPPNATSEHGSIRLRDIDSIRAYFHGLPQHAREAFRDYVLQAPPDLGTPLQQLLIDLVRGK